MKFQVLLLIAIFFALSTQAQTQPKYSRVKILLTQEHNFIQLTSLGLATDHGEYRKDVYFISDFSVNEILAAKNAGFQVEVLIDDVVQHYIDQKGNGTGVGQKTTGTSTCDTAKIPVTTPSHFHLGTYGGYFKYQEMITILDSMQLLYPNLISVKQQIGTFVTIENRPIYWVRVSNNPSVNQPGKPQMLYTAVHHAREPGSLSSTIFYLWYLLEHYATDPQIQAIVDNNELYFVPCINPDGYLFNQTGYPTGGGMWRKNRRHYANNDYGADLNRNYAKFWGFDNIGSSNQTSSETYRGTAAFSEPETQAIKWFCDNHQFQIALNYHTYQNDVLFPYGHVQGAYTPDSFQYNAYGDFLTENNNYRSGTCIEMLGYLANGGADDWMYGEQTSKPKIFGFTPEIGDPSLGFYPPSSYIIPYCKENLIANIAAASLLQPYAKLQSTQSKILALPGGFLHYNLKRLGLPNVGTFTVSATSLSAQLTISPTPKIYSSLSMIQVADDSLSYTVDVNTPNNTSLSYVLKINNGYYDMVDTVQVYYQKYVTTTNLATNTLAGWTNNGWGLSTSIYYSAPNSVKSTITGSGNYYDNTTVDITTTNPIDLADATKAYLQFYTRWDIEQKYDFAMVEASDITTTNWIPLCGRYTRPGVQYQIDGAPLYDGLQKDWVQEQMDLSAFLGKKIKIRYELASDNSGNRDGFYFDDVQVVASYDAVVKVKNNYVENGVPSVYPNPAKDVVTISLPAFNAGHDYQATVYDCLGRVVTTQALEQALTKINVAGLAANVYYLKITDNGKQYPVQKIELMR